MNVTKLRQAEASFLQRYPGGFADPGLDSIRKRHNIDKLSAFTRESFSRSSFNRPELICEALVKVISRSSMVSRFEKPKFKSFMAALNSHEKEALAASVERRLYGRQKRQGFEEILGMLAHHKLAKWAVISAVPFYFAPNKEAFVKPTTAKGIIRYLELPDLHYAPLPSWDFYRGYLQLLADIKKQVVPTLTGNNAAITGFMMMSIE